MVISITFFHDRAFLFGINDPCDKSFPCRDLNLWLISRSNLLQGDLISRDKLVFPSIVQMDIENQSSEYMINMEKADFYDGLYGSGLDVKRS